MPIELEHYQGGDSIVTATVNADFAEIAAKTGTLDTDSLRTEAVEREHCNTSLATGTGVGPVMNWGYKRDIPAGTTGTYNNIVYQLINHSGVGMRLAGMPQLTLEEGDVLRIHGTVFVKEGVQDQNETDAVLYYFKFFWDINPAGITYTPVDTVAQYTYSYAVRPATEPASISVIKNVRRMFSFVYIHTGATITVDDIACYVRVADANNSITIEEYGLYAFVEKH